MNDAVKIDYKYDYVFHIEFDNGIIGDVDIYKYLEKGPVFAPLKEMSFSKGQS